MQSQTPHGSSSTQASLSPPKDSSTPHSPSSSQSSSSMFSSMLRNRRSKGKERSKSRASRGTADFLEYFLYLLLPLVICLGSISVWRLWENVKDIELFFCFSDEESDGSPTRKTKRRFPDFRYGLASNFLCAKITIGRYNRRRCTSFRKEINGKNKKNCTFGIYSTSCHFKLDAFCKRRYFKESFSCFCPLLWKLIGPKLSGSPKARNY